MSCTEVYTIMPSDSLCHDPNAPATGDWYPPTSVSYNDAYMTPYPSTSFDQEWSGMTRTATLPQLSMTPHALTLQPPSHSIIFDGVIPNRPRSSPSTFGPSPESINWPSSNALGIQYNAGMTPPPPLPSTFEHFAHPEQFSAPATPELRQPVPRRPYQSIAPNPAGMVATAGTGSASKRRRRDDEEPRADSAGPGGKRRKRTASVNSADLSEDDRYLVQLKEDESLPWKEIATRFQTDKGKSFQVAALQMRYKRLREKFRVWEETDVNALKLAHEYWNKYKWEIISQKMTEFGNPERWNARHCARKWQELELSTAASLNGSAGMTPAMSQFSTSPVDAPVHFSFMPMS